MTDPITIERKLLERCIDYLSGPNAETQETEDKLLEDICAALAAPATAPEQPAWRDAPTVQGLWISDDFEGISTFNSDDLQAFKASTGVRWFGPIPEDNP